MKSDDSNFKTLITLKKTVAQQKAYISRMMDPSLKQWLGEIPQHRLLILLEWDKVKFCEPTPTYFHIPGKPEQTVYMAVCKHDNGQRWISFNLSPEEAYESVSRKVIYHLKLFDPYHGNGFTQSLLDPTQELS